MADSISLEQIQEQREQLLQTVNNLTAQKAQLEEQLENVKAGLATNQGALQYANALISSLTDDAEGVVEGNAPEEEAIEVPEGGETPPETVSL